jgi:integrase
MPRVNPKKQYRPTFPAAQVSQIVEGVKGVYKMLFIVLAATGLRIGEAIGLKVENVLDDTKGVTGKKAGEHAFRRFRDVHLRSQRCPSGLVKYWIGHSRNQDMSDLYDGSVDDEA